VPVLAANADDLLAAADRGLYRAKNSGRDRVVVADRATRPVATRLTEDVADRIRKVLEEGRLSAAFQPVVEIRSGRVVGYEALARVTGSSMAPPGWLELAVGAGLRDELEIAMWDAALEAWTAAGTEDDLVLWLNISPDVLVGGLPLTRRERLPSRVVLELSELAPVRSYPRLRAVLDEWRDQRGREVRFAIDDVGAGHANLRHIIELAPDITKLDRSLVDDVADNPTKQAVVRGLVGFCRDIGSALVAEGVEHQRCVTALRSLGVEWAQGWFFGRPDDLLDVGQHPRSSTGFAARPG
ncbi:MAG TPA: EAL domain-containing protein, partial [Euzebyales bacterium]|nr:EAL domain-containing protein [Euzebyales bacterium]